MGRSPPHPEETAGIVRLQRKGKPAPDLVRDLFEWTDGWAGITNRFDRFELVNQLLTRHNDMPVARFYYRIGFCYHPRVIPEVTCSNDGICRNKFGLARAFE